MVSHPSEPWGDALSKKHENVCRIGLLNPMGFTVEADSTKDNQLWEFMRAVEIDIMNFPEVNVCWHKVSLRNRLEERTMGWFESSQKLVAYNVHEESPNWKLFGGNVIFSIRTETWIKDMDWWRHT
jgi:hypothetical protein